jgi:GT2 family glycosyltransferase
LLDLVVQIVNYNSLSYTQKCLASVIKELDLCNLKYIIIIWDNNSDEDFQDWADRIDDQRIKFYFSEQNIGFGQAHNAMSKFFDSKYILVLNPDTIIENGAIKNMHDFMDNHEEVGMCGPRIKLPGYNYLFHKDQFWPWKFTIKDFLENYLGIKI